jgi:methionyl-tRNA synthetase
MTNHSESSSFFSSALPYVNAPPHLGHALELVQADAIARFRRLKRESVRLVSGSDDNSLKNVRAAEHVGQEVSEFVRKNALRFEALNRALGIGFDDFVHTGSDPRHSAAVHELWKRCAEAGDVYESSYRGRYCVGCEQFYATAELVEGRCPEHGTLPELVDEKNWFFRLSRYGRKLEQLIDDDVLRVQPLERKAEVLSFVRGGLTDFSISRSRARARGWGIPVPGDPEQVVFVWFDALAGYLSALGFPAADPRFDRHWQNAVRRTHLIGKGILRFHAVYWPAILLSARVLPPSELLVHGYLTVEGKKIGKSLGNAIDPNSLIGDVGVDALRWFLLRHVHPTKDSDFSRARLIEVHDADLADQVGNLLQRALTLLARHTSGRVPKPGVFEAVDQRLIEAALRAASNVEDGFETFALHEAGAAALGFVAATNRYLDDTRPWSLWRLADARPRLDTVLYQVAEALRFAAALLAPFVPAASERVFAQLGTKPPCSWSEATRWNQLAAGSRVELGSPLFPKTRATSPREPESQRADREPAQSGG